MVSLGTLASLYYETAYLIDEGYQADIESARKALKDGEVLNFLDEYEEIDLGVLSDEQYQAVNELLARHGVTDAHHLSIGNNGLGLIASNFVQILHNATYKNPDSGEKVDPSDLTVVEDW